jgi:hypothetical protein
MEEVPPPDFDLNLPFFSWCMKSVVMTQGIREQFTEVERTTALCATAFGRVTSWNGSRVVGR